jgi:uncharacterized protein (PEP-CTERM system associated)
VLVSAVTLQRDQRLAFTLLGRRSTLTLMLSRHLTSRLGEADTPLALGDLGLDSSLRQDGVTVNYSHRLTPTDSVNAMVAWQRSRGDVELANRLTTVLLSWSRQLSQRTSFSMSVRRSEFSSNTSPYDENALVASLARRF